MAFVDDFLLFVLFILQMALYMAFPVTTFWLFNQPSVMQNLGLKKEDVSIPLYMPFSRSVSASFSSRFQRKILGFFLRF